MSDSTLIPLRGKHGDGKHTQVSAEDYAYLLQFPWHLSVGGYPATSATRFGKPGPIHMHRIVAHRAGLVDAVFSRQGVDHASRDKLDNTRANLRCASRISKFS